MTILLQRLIEYAWIFYVACAIGVLFHLVRALTAYRERKLTPFTLERETMTSRMVQAWAMMLVFIAIGAAVFISVRFILPNLSAYDPEGLSPTPTSIAGVEPPTPTITTIPSPTASLQIPTLQPTREAVPTPPPPDTPTPPPPEESGTTVEVRARFGDFAELVSCSVPSTEINTAQPLQLTLYWRALEGSSSMNYVVFTHLLSESGETHLVAQDDDQPADGARPITGWSSGETIVDVHPMLFLDPDYTGAARIEVGLYDPAAPGDRVLTNTGNDHVVLPLTLRIVPP